MKLATLAVLMLTASAAMAAPVTYNVDPSHTFPSFEADHFGGLSKWRGKIEKSSGMVVLDRENKSGTVNISMDMSSINFGVEKLNEHAKSGMFDVAQFPTATYSGKFSQFIGDKPTEVDGMLTLHGVSKSVKLTIKEFKCIFNPMIKNEVCGADAVANINRADFGVDYLISMGFKPEVALAIQIEAIKAN